MTERDLKILKHIGLYTISVRPVLEHLFFDGGNSDNTLQRLRREGRLQVRPRGLPGGYSYYQLSAKQARDLRIPDARRRAGGIGPLPLHRLLSVLWYCCMGTKRRYRLEHHQLREHFGDAPLQGPHCAYYPSPSKACIYRIYVPGSTTRSDRRLVHVVQQDFRRARSSLLEWTRNRRYGAAILVETRGRKRALDERINRVRLRELAEIRVDIAPGPTTLKRAIDAYKEAP